MDLRFSFNAMQLKTDGSNGSSHYFFRLEFPDGVNSMIGTILIVPYAHEDKYKVRDLLCKRTNMCSDILS